MNVSEKERAGARLYPIREVSHDHLCNEAESGSLALRLAHSLFQASTPGLPPAIAGRSVSPLLILNRSVSGVLPSRLPMMLVVGIGVSWRHLGVGCWLPGLR